MYSKLVQRGVSFVELLMFIVIVSVGITGILVVMNQTTRHSSDPLARKQALAIAEALLEEVELQPFTYCDADDAAAAEVGDESDCSLPEDMGPEAGEGRYSTGAMFDNVNDYAGFSMNGIRTIDSSATATPINGLSLYNASVTVTEISEAERVNFNVATSDDVLRVAVRVTGPSDVDITLTGYRFRYAPRAI